MPEPDNAPGPWRDVSATFEVWEMWSAGNIPDEELTMGWQEVIKRMDRNAVAIIYTGDRLSFIYTGDRLSYRILALVEKHG